MLQRRLIGLVLVAVLSFGLVPSALAHDGDHSAPDFLVKTGGLIVSTFSAIRNPVGIVRAGAAMVSTGGAAVWGQQYGIHALMKYGAMEYIRTTTSHPLMTVTTGY